jgi:DNA-binding LacI/PurR family transcriptional regulator
VVAPVSVDGARAAADTLLALAEPPTAVFVDDDLMASGVYVAARERGVAIPGDLSVVGFDDVDLARVLNPPLTTVAADAEGLGAAAFRALFAVLSGEAVAAEQVLPVRLVVRGSTAPPR